LSVFSKIYPYGRLLGLWFKSSEKYFALWGALANIGFSLLIVYINVFFTNWNRYFFDAIEKKDSTLFIKQILIGAPLILIIGLGVSLNFLFQNYYSFRWRQWLTQHIETHWLSFKNYYHLTQKKGFDNPDQRISQDIDSVTRQTVDITLSLLHNVTNLVTFLILLWQISNLIKLSFFGKALNVPGLLVYIALLYGILEIAFSFKIGRPLLSLNRKREKFEADYRYQLMRIYERREEITLHSGERIESENLRQAFESIRRNYLTYLKKEIYISSFQNIYGHLDQFIPIFLMGPSYFTGVISLGILMQVGQLFTQVAGSLGSIARRIENIYHYIASFQRLVSFEQQMIKEISPAKCYPQNADYIEVQPFTLFNQKEVIWKVPLIKVQKGERKVLMAPSGCGKSSLLRAIKGIEDFRIPVQSLCVPKQTVFIPQRPYMPLGTLRQCLSYPLRPVDNAELIPLLTDCQLGHLINLLDQEDDYQNRLSLGEQQRINFVRLVLQSPSWMILDEPISALDQSRREICIDFLLKKCPESGILIISHQQLDGFERIK